MPVFLTSFWAAGSTSLTRGQQKLSEAHRGLQSVGTLLSTVSRIAQDKGSSVSPGIPDQTCQFSRHRTDCAPLRGCRGSPLPASPGCDLLMTLLRQSASRLSKSSRNRGHSWGSPDPGKERETQRENWKEGRKERGQELRRERTEGRMKRPGYYPPSAPCPPPTEMLSTGDLRTSDP